MAAIYAADIFCDSCGDDIRERLAPTLKGAEIDETTYDSGDFPKHADDDEETDSPQHCGSHADCLEAETLPDGTKIGKLIGTNLTCDGVEYVREAIADGGMVAEYWAEQFSDYFA